jgi:hypothetical protein
MVVNEWTTRGSQTNSSLKYGLLLLGMHGKICTKAIWPKFGVLGLFWRHAHPRKKYNLHTRLNLKKSIVLFFFKNKDQ